MILRHYQVMREYQERNARHSRPLTHAGRFWVMYMIGVALVAAWALG